MNISQLLCVGHCANKMLDRRKQAPFTFDDIYAAAKDGALIDLFMKMDDKRGIEIFCLGEKDRLEMERAYADAVGWFKEQELNRAGVGDNPLCMVIAIVFHAVREFHQRVGS